MDTPAAFNPLARAMRGALIVAVALLCLITARTSIADDDVRTPAKNTPSMVSSNVDFTGDRLVLKSNIYKLTRLHDDSANWIALRGTIFRVTQDQTLASGTGDLLVMVDSVPCIVEQLDGKVSARRDRTHIGVGGLINCPTDEKMIQQMVQVGEVYKIPKDMLVQYGYFRSGWVYGALLVPYKYHFDDKSFSSATTIGPYLGYRMGGLGVETAFIGSFGLSSLSVANPSGSGDTSTIQGFSAAIGLIGGVRKNSNPMRFGVMLGKDWAGSNSAVRYKHEGKAWVAVQIGFSFSE